MDLRGSHDPDVSAAPRVDLERLDGLSPRAAGEGPRGVRSRRVEGETTCERRELLRPHGPDDPRDPVRPPGNGARNRSAETRAHFHRPLPRGASRTLRPVSSISGGETATHGWIIDAYGDYDRDSMVLWLW